MNLYNAIVENDYDPEMLGRVQVRIVGKHTENRTDSTQDDYLPVDDLPWATCLQLGSAISNESNLFAVPKNGTVVIVAFMDAEEQKPIILGTVPKMVGALPDFTEGFSDPNAENPTADSVGYPSISNYATSFPVPEYVINKAGDVETGVTCIGQVWSEPTTTFGPIYPYNLVLQNGDQVLELDATPENERVNLQHTSGTFEETHPDGSQVRKIKGTEYVIVESGQNVLVKGGHNITVQGITGYNLESLGNVNIESTAEVNIDSELADINLTAPLMINIAANGTVNITSDSVININATGACFVTGSLISLN